MTHSKQKGMTLVELLISLALSLFLIAGMSEIFMQSQKNFTLERNLSDMTEDAVFILDFFTRSLSIAGYTSDGKREVFTPDNAVMGTKINFIQGDYLSGLDSELLYRFKVTDKNDLNHSLCTSTLDFKQNERITLYLYRDKDSNGVPVFYCKVKQEGTAPLNAKPLISQVEKIEFRYGVHLKNDLNNANDDTFCYAKSADVMDWQSVFAVKLFLVMRSADNNLTQKKMTYTIENTAYEASDYRLYRVFSKTVYLQALAQ